MRARHSSAALYAAMPPATPRTTLGSPGVSVSRRSIDTSLALGCFGRRFVDRRSQPRDLVLHKAAPHFLGRDDRGLPSRSGEERPRAGLQLAGAFGGHNDESVSALLWIVGDGAMGVIFRALLGHNTSQSQTWPGWDGS